MAELFSYINQLSPAGLLLHAAFLLFGLLIVFYLLPSKSKSSKRTNNGKRGSKASNTYSKSNASTKPTRAEKAAAKAAAQAEEEVAAKAKAAAAYNAAIKKHSWLHPFGRKKQPVIIPSRPTDPNKLNETLDFLNPNPEPQSKDFKHPKANDSYRELIKPGAAMSEAIPDLDDLDRIFSVMLKAGAITGKMHLVTNYEHLYLEKLRLWFGSRCYIYCQVSVGSAVQINADVSDLNMTQRRTFAQKCNNMSFDFMLIDRATDRIVCAIELDDPTHQRIERKLRDRRLDKVCKEANIPIFHITNVYQKPDLSRIRF